MLQGRQAEPAARHAFLQHHLGGKPPLDDGCAGGLQHGPLDAIGWTQNPKPSTDQTRREYRCGNEIKKYSSYKNLTSGTIETFFPSIFDMVDYPDI